MLLPRFPQHLTNLQQLRHLRWNVGGALDPLPDPLALAKLSQLAVLTLTPSGFAHMNQFHALDIKNLRHFDLEVNNVLLDNN